MTHYIHTDNLGSISVITDQKRNVLEQLSYDAWGKRRFQNGADNPADSIPSQTTRGFIDQDELSVSSLVHLGRMTSADPTAPYPLNPQA
jgi:hypothetical protein